MHRQLLGVCINKAESHSYQEQTNVVQPALIQSTYVDFRHSKVHAGFSSCILLMLRRAKMQQVSLQRHIDHILHLQGRQTCCNLFDLSLQCAGQQTGATDLPVDLLHWLIGHKP